MEKSWALDGRMEGWKDGRKEPNLEEDNLVSGNTEKGL